MKIICKNKDAIATGWVIANFPDDQPGLIGGVCGILPKTIFAEIAPLGSLVLLAGWVCLVCAG